MALEVCYTNSAIDNHLPNATGAQAGAQTENVKGTGVTPVSFILRNFFTSGRMRAKMGKKSGKKSGTNNRKTPQTTTNKNAQTVEICALNTKTRKY